MMAYTTRTIQRAHALGIPVALMHAVDEQDWHTLSYWQGVKRACETQGTDFQERLWAIFYPWAPLGLHD